ncbi:MAG: DUF882 domain-containing protein [Alphaproteobacteria bacterium]|nr:DUF882 domain-containing protein [Alphaproteobacteria bacterium]
MERREGALVPALNRRQILKSGFVGLLAATIPTFGFSRKAEAAAAWRISLRHAHSNEAWRGVYRVGDRYLPEAFEKINYLLRDVRTGEAFPMDPRVLDIASIIQRRISGEPLSILSGYRSPRTNAMLREASTGVAKNSMHMYGQALDIRTAACGTKKLCGIAKGLRAGGVGYYPRSNFVHVDTGAVRSW